MYHYLCEDRRYGKRLKIAQLTRTFEAQIAVIVYQDIGKSQPCIHEYGIHERVSIRKALNDTISCSFIDLHKAKASYVPLIIK